VKTPAEEQELRFVDPVEPGRDLLAVNRPRDGEELRPGLLIGIYKKYRPKTPPSGFSWNP
jgi:hypothetical protein